MTKEELETKEKLKLMNIAKEWLRTEHSEGNVYSLVNFILSFAEPREKRIAELEKECTKAKEIINDCVCELQNILFYKMRNKERIASTLDKAEQFLSEVEK